MSRIGRLPVAIPAGVTVEIAENNKVTVKGPKGTLERELPTEMSIKFSERFLPLCFQFLIITIRSRVLLHQRQVFLLLCQ